MAVYLGIDTSNYTTSTALFDSGRWAEGRPSVRMEKKLLPTAPGALGLRQSDAVFAHVQQLGGLAAQLFGKEPPALAGVGVSIFPRRAEGSYMPCFLVGQTAAELTASALGVPLYTFSHQEGHIAAALYSAGRLDLMKERFIAFHLSGGTTDALLVEPGEPFFRITPAAHSLDLKAGQAVDRVGLMLGLKFPCGPELTELALQCEEKIRVRPTMKGADCCLSGVENRCRRLLDEGKAPEYIALYCLKSIEAALEGMTQALLERYGELPLVYAGGVMSNVIIRQKFESKYGGIFAQPQFSSDNAAGIAVLAALSAGEDVCRERKAD